MTGPLWVDVEAVEHPRLDRDVEVDVAIVGGGLTGIGAAWALRESALRVALLEERTLGSGASGRNGGFVLAGPAMSYCDAVSRCGAEAAQEVWQLTLANNRLMAELVERYSIDCGFLRCGSMSLAVDEEELAILHRCRDALEASGISTALLTRDELPVPFHRVYLGGIYYPGNGEMNSGAFVRGVGRRVAATTQIFEQTTVRSLSREGSWVLETAGGTIRAAAVILATNAYTGRLLPEVPLTPTRGQVVATVPVDRVIVPFPIYANYGYQYWRQTVDGRLVVGGWRDIDLLTEVGTEERANALILQHLEDFVRMVAGDVSIEYRWSGIMAFTPDEFPLVGAVPDSPGLFIAAGYSGHGVSMAFTCGSLTAQLALGQSPAIPELFHPGRHLEAEPLDVGRGPHRGEMA
jgi:glycine/D-amino acid oxidase-like deaminating enzyme